MPFRHAIGKDDIALGVVRAQRQNLLVGARFIPRTRPFAVGKLDDNQVSRPSPLQDLYLSTMYQEPAREWLQRRIDALKLLHYGRSHCDFAQVGDGVCRHQFLEDFLAGAARILRSSQRQRSFSEQSHGPCPA